jgi:uncharacterized protein (DUF433 family)
MMERLRMKETEKQKAQMLGRYIVADHEICHGKPTFRGTRIMVFQVLELVARGMGWENITERWRGSITKEAIAEAVQLSDRGFLEMTQPRDF